MLRAPKLAEKIEHRSVHRLSQNHSPVTRPSSVWADYTGIYLAECAVSAEHLVGVTEPLLRKVPLFSGIGAREILHESRLSVVVG